MRDVTQMAPSVSTTGARKSSDSYQCTTHAMVMAATLGITHRVGARHWTFGRPRRVSAHEMPLVLLGALLAAAVAVSPSAGHRHDRFTVAITSGHATGVFGRTRRSYVAEAHAVRPASGCVNNRDRVFPDRHAGARVRAVLDPARGEGGPEGWCRGRFRGTVTYAEAFACPAAGTCHPRHGFPTRTVVVARFSFRVR